MTSFADPFGLVGQVLDQQFRVDALVGEGGFSAVYRGHHLGLDEPVALKCMKLEASLGKEVVESFLARFRDESRLLYRLSQGNLDIVRSIASGTAVSPTTGEMVPYMALEWLEGRSLAAELMVRREMGAQGRPLHEAIAMLDSAADALAYAHSQGVIHRDLNPGNFFIAQTRLGARMKVLDFGVAKVVRDEILALGPRAQTLANVRIFSPPYAAPEQFDERIGAVAPSTDVWSLAVVLSEMICDRPVFDGDSLGAFFQKVLDPSYPRSPRKRGLTIGDATEAVFAKALSMSPLARFPDVGVFWSELRLAMSRDLGGSTLRGSSNPFQPTAAIENTQAAKPVNPNALDEPEPTLLNEGLPGEIRAQFERTMRPDQAVAAQAAFTDMKGTLRMAQPQVVINHVQQSAQLAHATTQLGQAATQPFTPPPLPPEPPPKAAQLPAPPLVGPTPSGLFQGAPVAPATNAAPPVSLPGPAFAAAPEIGRPQAGGRRLLLIVVVAVLLLALGAVVALATRKPKAPVVVPSATAAAVSVPAPTPPPIPTFDPPPTATPATVDTSTVPSAAVSAPAPVVSARPAAIPVRPGVTHSTASPFAFDPKAARAALDVPASILSACKDRSNKTGPGVAHVTFGNDGAVSNVTIDKAPYAGTAEAECITGKLRRAKLPPFEGPSGTIDYSFTIAR